jgi:YHS domain-containing protein
MPGLKHLALEAAKGQSAVGSWGHMFARPDGRLFGYGMMNSPGLPLTISLVMARTAGVKDPAVDRAIELSARLMRFYIGKGAVPYGDHDPWIENHDDNGKCGMAAVLFNLLGENDGAEFFSRMSVACHGPDKAKGGLRLDSLQAVLKGGKSGAILVPGNAAASELIKRLRLAPDHDDHMPPAGKPQPTADEVALLQWWIDAGAAGDKTATELKLPANLQSFIAPQAAAPASPEPPPAAVVPETATAATVATKPLAEVLPLAQRLASELGIALLPLAQGEPWLQANASLARANFGDAELAKLAPLAANLRWLDLTGTAITDKGMAQVAGMPHLTRLHLARTAVTDAGLQQLAPLEDLAYLNLHGTPLTDAALERLKPLRKLRQLFLWQTGISSSAAQSFAEHSLDKDQIARWQAEIAELNAQIKCQGIAVDLGTPLAAAEPPASKPINDKCPVSDKAVDPTKTSVYEGKLVGFCCADCKATFDKDPKPYLAKLGLVAATPPTEPEKKP